MMISLRKWLRRAFLGDEMFEPYCEDQMCGRSERFYFSTQRTTYRRFRGYFRFPATHEGLATVRIGFNPGLPADVFQLVLMQGGARFTHFKPTGDDAYEVESETIDWSYEGPLRNVDDIQEVVEYLDHISRTVEADSERVGGPLTIKEQGAIDSLITQLSRSIGSQCDGMLNS